MKKITKRFIAIMFAALFAVIGTTSVFALTACSDCGRIFESNSAYSVHTRVCKPDSTKKITYVCSYCEAAYETKAMFSAHVDSCLMKPAIPVKGNANACEKCLEVFDYEDEYNNHIQICRDVYACSKCSKEYTTAAFRNAHYIACNFIGDDVVTEVSIVDNPGSISIKYGDILKLEAEALNLPQGASIKWYADGDSVELTPSADGKSCEIEAVGDGKSTVFVRVVDADENPLRDIYGTEVYDMEVVDCDGGFLQKIISFFKNLFRMDRTVTN